MQEQTVLRLLLGQRIEHLLDRRVVQPHLCLGPHPPQIRRRRRPHERDARRVLWQVGLEVHGPGVQPDAAQVVADGSGGSRSGGGSGSGSKGRRIVLPERTLKEFVPAVNAYPVSVGAILFHTFPLQADGAVAELGVLSRPVRCDEVRADLHTGLRFFPEL